MINFNIYRTQFVLFFCFFIQANYCQQIPLNEYNLPVVTSYSLYLSLIEKDSSQKLVDVTEYLPGVVLDIRYATENNFTGKVLYPEAKSFARLPVVKALQKVRAELQKENLDIKIFDTYRPYSITKTMWEYVQDDRYAATPEKGSRHNRGCAIDLTLVDLQTGNEIEMPTEYDAFSVKSHDYYMDLPEAAIFNRARLRDVMEKFGFKHLNSEWWHFDFIGWENYPLMDLSFKELSEQND